MARELLPHEAFVRAQLRRLALPPEDVDDVIQECYCQFAEAGRFDHIERPAAYFLKAARYIVGRRRLRARVVPIDAHAEMDLFEAESDPSPEQAVAGRRDFDRLREMMAALPDRCRRIVELRKFEGWSQKEIAERMGVSEKVVEKQVWLGVRALRSAWKQEDLEAGLRLALFEGQGEGS